MCHVLWSVMEVNKGIIGGSTLLLLLTIVKADSGHILNNFSAKLYTHLKY